MFSLKIIPWAVAIIVAVASFAAAGAEYTVVAIGATPGGPITVSIVESSSSICKRYTSASILTENALLPALLSGAKLGEIVVVPGTSAISRVYAYELGDRARFEFYGDYVVSRIATQRMQNGLDEHLEAFLAKKGSKDDKAYSVYDPYLQQLLIAAFGWKDRYSLPQELRVDVKFDDAGEQIVAVNLGAKCAVGQ